MKDRICVRNVFATAAAALAAQAGAQPLDFTTFVDWQGGGAYPLADTFVVPIWDIRDAGATAVCLGNANASIFYNGSIDLNGKRVTGTIFPGIDDDLVGFAFGYTSTDDFNPDAKFWIIDWKGTDQSFEFDDDPTIAPGTFHDITVGPTLCGAGMRLLEGRGTPTADELWSGSDMPENDMAPFAPGGVETLGRAATLGRLGYDRDVMTSYQFDMDLTPTNVKVWINGVLQFDVNAPMGETFETMGFGVVEEYQDGGTTNPDEALFTNFSIADSPGTAPTGPGLNFPAPTTSFTGGLIDAIEPAGTWSVAVTTADNPIEIVTAPNTGDVAFNANGNAIYHFDGISQGTTRQNTMGTSVVTTEISHPSTGFGINGAIAGATAFSPSGGEANANFAIGFFPFAEGWMGACPGPGGIIFDNPLNATVVQQPSPDLNDQDGLYDVTLPGGSPADGLFFVCGASNEDNYATAISMGGGWRVAVRDNGSAVFGGPEAFENDDFCFLYVPVPGAPDRIRAGASVANFDINGNAMTILSHGSYTLTREGTGSYRLNIAGETPTTGMLLLTANSSLALADPDGVLADDNAPANQYLTYEPAGNDFLIQQVQMDTTTNPPADGPFSFAFVSFGGAAPACPCELDGDDAQVDVFDLLAYLDLWFANDPGADIDGTPGVDVFDLLSFLDCWFPASAGTPCP